MLLGIAFLRRDVSTYRFATALEVCTVLSVAGAVVALPMLPESLHQSAALMPLRGLSISVFARQRGKISRFLSHPWCIRLGEVSFAFYMVHYVVLVSENRLLGWAHPAFALAVGLGLTLSASFALFYWVETPMRTWIRGLSHRRLYLTKGRPTS